MRKAYPLDTQSLKDVVGLQEYIKRNFFHAPSPFLSEGVVRLVLRGAVLVLVAVLEKMFLKKLFVENLDKELFSFRFSSLNLLRYLISTGHVKSWECEASNISGKTTFACKVTSEQMVVDDKVVCEEDILNGSGTDIDLSNALNIACAELVERRAASNWEKQKIVRSSVRRLEGLGIEHWAQSHSRPLTEAERELEVGWVNYRSLTGHGTILVPASMTYLFYANEYYDENIFLDPNSNGLAAHLDEDRATLAALYEIIERDGFLLYWLTKKPPRRINKASIKDSEIQMFLDTLDKRAIDVELLDCSSDLSVPVIVGVLIDRRSKAVHVDAAASLSVTSALTKVVTDALRWNPDMYDKVPTNMDPAELFSIPERRRMWYSDPVRFKIQDFLIGEEIDYQLYVSKFKKTLPERELTVLLQKFSDLKKAVYVHSFKNKLTEMSGLSVIRAFVPGLLHMYFIERNRPILSERLCSFGPIDAVDINDVPHPFV